MADKANTPPQPRGGPTAPENPEQAAQPQRPGGGGSPGTGETAPPPSPGEGVTEEQMQDSGRE